MRKIHVAIVALLIGIAAVLGTAAATRTTDVGAAATSAQDAAIAKRASRLNAFEASLKRQLEASSKKTAATPSAAPRVEYRRPAPIVVTRHSSNGEHEFESESEHEGGDD